MYHRAHNVKSIVIKAIFINLVGNTEEQKIHKLCHYLEKIADDILLQLWGGHSLTVMGPIEMVEFASKKGVASLLMLNSFLFI